MNRLIYGCALLLMAGCASEPVPVAEPPVAEAPEAEEAPATGETGLPPEVAEVATRLEGCTHFGGEIGDNDPERTAQIEAAMDELGCEQIDEDVARVRETYAGDPAVEEALRAATEL